MPEHNAAYRISHLHLTTHVEGGAFAEVYRSPLLLPADALPATFDSIRHSCTHIYFLPEQAQFSAFHRIQSDELRHFYAGGPLAIYEIDSEGRLITHLPGNDPEKGQSFFCMVKAGHWFASRPAAGTDYSLCGCTVSPGFDFADFELAFADQLAASYPQHAALIHAL
ncbi:MAG TPA: cupin domain-containing protein, partial [Chitinophagaceae bacterium]|nr:cupin domain-containing protein [Chitinophagaceae bacterium]